MMTTIERLTTDQARAVLPDLIELLQDVAAHGASVGFLPPLTSADAEHYWQDVIADLQDSARLLLVARDGAGVTGTAQLDLPSKPNARHRAEVQKVLGQTRARRQGIGRALMLGIEVVARQIGRSLLVLDTRQGDAAEQLYRQLGYTVAGTIPQYAQSADGQLDTSVFFYRILPDND